MTVLSVYTPTHRRPKLLEQCRASVAAQTVEVEHLVVVDEVGIGIDGMYAAIPKHAHLPTGDYVMVLSDDNILVDERVAEEMRVELSDPVDVLMFKGQIGGTVQPALWRAAPEITKVDLSCFAVRRDVWVAHAKDWGRRYEGDFDFIRALWDAGCSFRWWDRLVFRALQIGRGEPE